MQPKSSKTTGMRLATVLQDDRRYVFKNRCIFFGSNLFVTQNYYVFLSSTGFSLHYANFDNLLEIRCDQPQLLLTADQCLDLVFVLLFVH